MRPSGTGGESYLEKSRKKKKKSKLHAIPHAPMPLRLIREGRIRAIVRSSTVDAIGMFIVPRRMAELEQVDPRACECNHTAETVHTETNESSN